MRNTILRLAVTIALVLCTTVTWGAILPTKSSFVLAIGQKTAMYVIRGDCTGPVPSFSAVKADLPKTSLGNYSDGGTGTRESARCKGMVKVRIISFTGTKAGKQTLTVAGERITVQVK